MAQIVENGRITDEGLRRGIAAMEETLKHPGCCTLDTSAEITARTRDCTRAELEEMFRALNERLVQGAARQWRAA